MVAPVSSAGIGAAQAAAAYRSTAQPAAAEEPAGGTSFGALLERVAQGALQAGHGADKASAAALSGAGNVTEVVMAVSQAELALQTVVAVRDRVVNAYQDVMRMPI